MVFSSSIFLIYFLPVFLLVYFLADRRYRNYVALAGSIIFFAWAAPVFIGVVLITVLINYLVGLWIPKLNPASRKTILVSAIVINVAILLFFQYSNFFITTLNTTLAPPGISQFSWMKYLLPVGISFITFHQLSYLIDVHRETAPPMKNFWHYALFILYFPQLINGPITRANEMSGQITEREANYTADNRIRGFIRFIIGLGKKVLIANVLGNYVDQIFALDANSLTTPLAWLGIVGYAFQIYFDFAGYSDMAIGLARMMGFVFPENFNNPYTSQNVTEFWRRWHITLSTWLRDYLFMPMSVSMRSAGKIGLIISVLVTFLICGMWHNPGWTFILWGAWHGLWLALDQLFLIKVLKKTGRLISTIITFVITTVGWVFFRSENLKQTWLFMKRLFVYSNNDQSWNFRTDFWVMMGIAAFFSFIVAFKPGRKLEEIVFEKTYNTPRTLIMGCIAILLLVVCMGSINTSGFIPFIYNRF